ASISKLCRYLSSSYLSHYNPSHNPLQIHLEFQIRHMLTPKNHAPTFPASTITYILRPKRAPAFQFPPTNMRVFFRYPQYPPQRLPPDLSDQSSILKSL